MITNLPDWIMAGCAVLSLIIAAISLRTANGASKTVTSLKAQVETINAELNRVSSTMKDSKVKQTNKSGSNNQFVGGSYNG